MIIIPGNYLIELRLPGEAWCTIRELDNSNAGHAHETFEHMLNLINGGIAARLSLGTIDGPKVLAEYITCTCCRGPVRMVYRDGLCGDCFRAQHKDLTDDGGPRY